MDDSSWLIIQDVYNYSDFEAYFLNSVRYCSTYNCVLWSRHLVHQGNILHTVSQHCQSHLKQETCRELKCTKQKIFNNFRIRPSPTKSGRIRQESGRVRWSDSVGVAPGRVPNMTFHQFPRHTFKLISYPLVNYSAMQ